ncbi:TetR/AcrR family transcriptional regulator [Aliisedimentitalea scapharcae]|uniref:TetR/AcrR family transcriptional regulator n=1 Tax=Aliisedimentitalea scapharcae TaxID=1524259 RepID=A0ABZ2XQG0_9RHOB|nr:TetR family transcriptional regulator [Rhodobacteraceae bacterium M382]
MNSDAGPDKQRQRAPSQRSLQTRARILDAAERLFAERGFDGTSMRDIAVEAQVQVGLVSHHAGNKAALFHVVVARRADELSRRRLEALAGRRAVGDLDVPAIMECFLLPYLELARTGGAQWMAYARLVAYVSADTRWRSLAMVCFDPVAQQFVDEIAALYPRVSKRRVSAGFTYSVAALLAQVTSAWRIEALGGEGPRLRSPDDKVLLTFCVAGMEATLK